MSILVKDKNVIVPQEIEIPLDSNIDFGTFSRTLDDMSASYKTFWLIAILDELIAGNTKIYFKKLINDYVSDLTVVSYNEIKPNVELQSVGMVTA